MNENENENELEQKQVFFSKFEVKQIDELSDPEFFFFEGYAATFGSIDFDGDIIRKGAFTKSLLAKPDFKILWQHNTEEPIGVPVNAYEDEKGLFIKAKLPKTDDLVRGRIIPQMKVGSIKEMSIGYHTRDATFIPGDKGRVREIIELELVEVSLVTWGANPKAEVTHFKEKKYKDVDNLNCMKDFENILKYRAGMKGDERKVFISKLKDHCKDLLEEKRKKEDLIKEIKTLTNNLKHS